MNTVIYADEFKTTALTFLAKRATHLMFYPDGRAEQKFPVAVTQDGDRIVVVTEPLREDLEGPGKFALVENGMTLAVVDFRGMLSASHRVTLKLSLNECVLESKPDLGKTGVGTWCQPGGDARYVRHYLVMFDDRDKA